MRKLFLSGLIFVFLFSFSVSGQCWPWDKKSTSEQKEAVCPTEAAVVQQAEKAPATKAQPARIDVVSPVPSKGSMEKEKALRERIKGTLNGTQWEVELTALSGKSSKQKDNLNFKNNLFYSQQFMDKGFQPSNYTLTLQENGNAVIETMQSGDAGIIFWRIEFDPSLTVCKGVLSRQVSPNKTEDYSFVSVMKRPIPEPEPVKEEK